MKAYYAPILVTLLILQTPFIVCDFVFANRTECLHDSVPKVSLTLYEWLIVDGSIRAGVCAIYLLLLCHALLTEQDSSKSAKISAFIMFGFTVILFCWLVVGSVIFWGYLEKEKTCDANVTGYMWAILILGYFSIISYTLIGAGSAKHCCPISFR